MAPIGPDQPPTTLPSDAARLIATRHARGTIRRKVAVPLRADLTQSDPERAVDSDEERVFLLRFADEGAVTVTVHPADRHRRFTLTEYAGPPHRSIEHRWYPSGE
ncbi:hypothetical protein ACPPVO_59535 [Dactylosporangium sp. McL0621]|uniref:hypothetical protein n=1 Tax=Dactylosporangium sp. McL0621 TaxID=3415678 RepID=UPI003CF51A76